MPPGDILPSDGISARPGLDLLLSSWLGASWLELLVEPSFLRLVLTVQGLPVPHQLCHLETHLGKLLGVCHAGLGGLLLNRSKFL